MYFTYKPCPFEFGLRKFALDPTLRKFELDPTLRKF
jgi:hypothetical protein